MGPGEKWGRFSLRWTHLSEAHGSFLNWSLPPWPQRVLSGPLSLSCYVRTAGAYSSGKGLRSALNWTYSGINYKNIILNTLFWILFLCINYLNFYYLFVCVHVRACIPWPTFGGGGYCDPRGWTKAAVSTGSEYSYWLSQHSDPRSVRILIGRFNMAWLFAYMFFRFPHSLVFWMVLWGGFVDIRRWSNSILMFPWAVLRAYLEEKTGVWFNTDVI